MQMIEQSYGRYIRKDFLGPLIAARPEGPSEAAVEGKSGPLTRTPKGGSGEGPNSWQTWNITSASFAIRSN